MRECARNTLQLRYHDILWFFDHATLNTSQCKVASFLLLSFCLCFSYDSIPYGTYTHMHACYCTPGLCFSFDTICTCAYSLLMRANKLETALSRDRLACLAPPDMVFSCRCTPVGMGVFGGFIAPAQPVTGGFELGTLPSLLP